MVALVNSVVLLDWFHWFLCVLVIVTWFGMICYVDMVVLWVLVYMLLDGDLWVVCA